MKGKLYEYALIFHPKNAKDDLNPKPSQMIGPVKQIVATNENVVQMQAVRDIPQDYADKLDQIDVVVRPF